MQTTILKVTILPMIIWVEYDSCDYFNLNSEEVITQLQEPSVNTLNKNRSNENGGYKIHKLCITGGPCAGKTTGIL